MPMQAKALEQERGPENVQASQTVIHTPSFPRPQLLMCGLQKFLVKYYRGHFSPTFQAKAFAKCHVYQESSVL